MLLCISHPFAHLVAFSLLVLLASCGGIAVIDPGSGGASATTSATSATTGATGTATASTGSGPTVCTDHAACPGGVCVFSTGTCADVCDSDSCDPCAPGSVCEPCATASCPECKDCISACLPADGRCDENDFCSPGEVCILAWKVCAPSCNSDADCDGFSFCDDCATSSCCGCDNCVAACVGGE